MIQIETPDAHITLIWEDEELHECGRCHEEFPFSEGHLWPNGKKFRCYPCLRIKLHMSEGEIIHFCAICHQPTGYTNRYNVCGVFSCFQKALALMPATAEKLGATLPEKVSALWMKEVVGGTWKERTLTA